MPVFFTNTRPTQITIAGVAFGPQETASVPAAATLDKERARFLAENPKATEKEQEKNLEAFSADLLAKVRASSVVRAGFLIEAKGAAAPVNPGPAKVPTLQGLNLIEALAQIKLCQDVAILAEWVKGETRPPVLDALRAQVEKLAPGA